MNESSYLAATYDYRLVALSVVVALIAAYTALDLTHRVRAAEGRQAYIWLTAGTLTMGSGIWSMHFVGMLALSLPMRMGYALTPTVLSWFMSIVASGLALRLASRATLGYRRLLGGAFFMAAGIVSMHYTGMYAMKMEPGIVYAPGWVALSIVIALTASAAALWIAFALGDSHHLRDLAKKGGAATFMGIAIAGMHYSGMAAARFPTASMSAAVGSLNATWLALLTSACSIMLLGTALLAAALDRRLEAKTAGLLASLTEANAQLYHSSHHDPLTSLANRALLDKRLNQAIAAWLRDRAHFAVIYIDLDGFKALNDNLGHKAGDQLLERVATAMTQTVRHNDTVARVGGDEFVIVANGVANERAADHIGQKLLAAIAQASTQTVPLSASMGSALCPEHGESAAQLFTAADHAMYSAKARGKNRHVGYQADMARRAEDEFTLQNELGRAIAAGEIVVYYQPKHTTADRALSGAEALVRWQHPEQGLIPPGRFIPIAERSGQIDRLETHILRSVCADIRGWLDAGFSVPCISLNLSAGRIHNDGLPALVQRCLEEQAIDPRYIMFEITESLAIQEILGAIDTLKRFAAMGVDVALDDFGTGHSSLAYLEQLPIQQVKIDRSFIAAFGGHAKHPITIVRSIVSLAHNLGLRVVAEGVETEEQLSYLNQLDCDEVQGFLFSRPISAEAFIAYLTDSFNLQTLSA